MRELAAEQPFPAATRLEVVTEGAPRALQPLAVDEIVRIAGEALFNAARHAQPSKVEIRIVYAAQRLEVSVRDDGAGIDAMRLAASGRDGHYGLVGMQERARRLGAQLCIETGLGRGTTIRLSLPGGRGYLPRRWLRRSSRAAA